MSTQDAYEHEHFVAALQGLVNRHEPLLYILTTSNDVMWLNFLLAPGEWLYGTNIITIPTLSQLISTFRTAFHGVVLYDPKTPSTSLVASTIAGVEDLLPVCYRPVQGSIYTDFVQNGPKLPVKISLVGRFNGNITGSAKCDAYIWAKEQYLDRPQSERQANGSYLAYYIDYYWTFVADMKSQGPWLNTVTNHDYFIGKRAFFWDLDVWPDEAPNDDPHQPIGTDYRTLLAILLSAYKQTQGQRMIHIGGFTPWLFKYVDQKHPGVPTEWQMVLITSAYNAYFDADACCIQMMANAGFFQYYPLATSYKQNPTPTLEDLRRMGFVDSNNKVVRHNYFMFYVGDYDSAAWLYNVFKHNWDDPLRGQVPLGWAVDPNLMDRFPIIFDYIFRNLTKNDRLITGDSGAGYLNPTQLFVPRKISGLPAANDVWVAHNIPLYKKFDIQFTGFLINGDAGPLTDEAEQMYLPFSPLGLVESVGMGPNGTSGFHLQKGTPVFQETDLTDDVESSIEKILAQYQPNRMYFSVFRTILKSPTFHKQIVDELAKRNPDIVVVEPLVLSALCKLYLESQ